MKLVLGIGSGTGFYPYTMKPVDYQPYRPVYLFRGPPPDAGFSYGLFEDEEGQIQYYADMGLDPISPFSGKPSKLIEEMDSEQLKRKLDGHLDELEDLDCPYCGSVYKQNIRTAKKGCEAPFCHRCGGNLS